ncbi:cis-prenyltransferase [Steccherinum ochraceum]|uniref:Alkyl transferase n=1 Tax=Steccherinum ochraceum TaxID=92696 RepID=A0A4R0RLF4_9APHY|nr:cis-prenyltransferase [Steccherinum ochraceum]
MLSWPPPALWLQEFLADKSQRALLSILAAGPIPQHVAFVMDGNRRYARMHHQEVQQGHAEGYVALRRMLEICMRLGVRCVSVYSFSIENFKRSPKEVEALMDLAEEKLIELCQHGELLEEYGVRLNVVGKKELLPVRVQLAVEKAEHLTAKNDRSILNLCMPYTSRDEMATAVQFAVQEALENDDQDAEITEKDIDAHLMTTLAGSPPLDILVRTSGVKRLSDYLLWQCSENTQIQFSSAYWPDFGLWDFLPILLDFQRKDIISALSFAVEWRKGCPRQNWPRSERYRRGRRKNRERGRVARICMGLRDRLDVILTSRNHIQEVVFNSEWQVYEAKDGEETCKFDRVIKLARERLPQIIGLQELTLESRVKQVTS